MVDIPSHHLIYGTCTDFITGETVVDTDDERFRQKIARFLVEKKGYAKSDILVRQKIETLFAGRFVISTVDFVVRTGDRYMMLIRYGPGSLVTRERPAIAAARVLLPGYRIPFAIVTNGRDAELLDTRNGKVVARGLEGIPGKKEVKEFINEFSFEPLPESKKERELRILNAYDEEICCAGGPCPLPGAPEG